MVKPKRGAACVLGVVLGLGSLAAVPAFAAWVEQGPGPILNGVGQGIPNNPVVGAVSVIVPDLSRPGIVYAGTTNGGIWKTMNADDPNPSWAPLTDFQLPALSINALAISPLDPNTIFAGTGSMSANAFDGSPGFGIAKSTDGGATWTVLASSTFTNRRITSVVPTALSSGGPTGQVVLASTLFDFGGVYRSTDGGVSFARVSGTAGLPDAGVSSMVADPLVPTRLYAAVPQTYGGGAFAGVYRSVDGGANWTPVNAGLSGIAGSQRILLAVSRNTGVLYAMIINSSGGLAGVFRTADGGGSWAPMGVPSPNVFPGNQGWLHGAIAADPNNPNVVFVAGDRQDLTVRPNANGCIDYAVNMFRGDFSLGSPWQNVVCNGANGTGPHADARTMAFDWAGNLLQGSDGGVYRLNTPNTSGRIWISLNGNIRPTEITSAAYDPVSNIIFAGTQDNGTAMQNSPGGFTWTDFLKADGGVVAVDKDPSHPGTSIRYTSFQFLAFLNRSTWNASNALISGPTQLGLNIVAGAGAGQTLYQFDNTIQFYNPYVLNEIDPRRLLIGTSSIYESANQGDSLVNLGFIGQNISSLAYGGRLNGVPNPDVFYVGNRGFSGPFLRYRATAGGPIVPLSAYPGSGVRRVVMDPQDYRRIYVVDDQSRVWTSGDAGTIWTNLTANLRSFMTDVRTVEIFNTDPTGRNAVLVAGGLGGVVQMRRPGAAGTAWTPLSSGLPHALVLDLRYDYADNVLVAGTLGRGAWTLSSFFRGGGGTGADTATVARSVSTRAVAAEAQVPLAVPDNVPSLPPSARPASPGPR